VYNDGLTDANKSASPAPRYAKPIPVRNEVIEVRRLIEVRRRCRRALLYDREIELTRHHQRHTY